METRRAKRRWKRYHTAETEEAFRNARARKKKVLRKHKMEEHRARVTEAAATDHGIWRIAKWAKMRNDKTKTSRKIPTLVEGDFFAESTADKLRILGDSFFPTPPPPDMSDTLNFQYPDRIHNPGIHVTEVAAALDKTPPRKAPGLDQIPNHIAQGKNMDPTPSNTSVGGQSETRILSGTLSSIQHDRTSQAG